MLHCPPSRINLSNSDTAACERRFTAKQAAAKLAPGKPKNPRLNAGPRRLTRLQVVHADDRVACSRVDAGRLQGVIYGDAGDDKGVDVNPPRNSLSPPTIRAGDYDGAHPTSGRPINPPAERQSARRSPPGARLQRREGSIPTQRQSLLPSALDGISERRLRPSNTHYASWSSGSATLAARSPIQPSLRHGFVLYEDSAPGQAQIEAQHMHHRSANDGSTTRRAVPQSGPHAATRINPTHPVLAAEATPILLPVLNPGAPAFIPRTRFGSGTRGSEENSNGAVRVTGPNGPGSRISSTQSTSNLRIRSSFERNSQQTYRRRDSHGSSNVPAVPTTRPVPSQYRRRSHTSDQNTNMPVISTFGERYPAPRPPTSIPAPGRDSGAHRQAFFQRGASRHNLVDYQWPDPLVRPNHNQGRFSTQSKTSSLAVPDPPISVRASSAASSSNSRSTPNLFQGASPAPLVHSRSNSLSWDRFISQHDRGYRVPSVVSAASGISGSSPGNSHQLGHVPFEESMLSRGSPLDELLLDFGRFNIFPDDRPRSVGRSFELPPGGRNRISFLSGDIFQQETSHAQSDGREDFNTARHPLKVANDSSFSEEDAVALSLALPSPNMPSSSPIATNSPQLPALAEQSAHLTPQSSATRSAHSASSIIPELQTTATPRVHIYDDRKSPRTQPQTPADISKSTRQARTRTTAMSRDDVGTIAGGLFSPVIPERRPHRPYTYPAGTPPDMVDGTAVPARMRSVEQSGQQSLHVRGERRDGSGSRENDVEGNLAGLNADRRIWMARREEGSLDITPPREGRFERYLR